MSAEHESLFSFRDLTANEIHELRLERINARVKSGDFSYSNEPPWTPSEARWHAREFIAHNGHGNLVRMLAEAYLKLQDAAAPRG